MYSIYHFFYSLTLNKEHFLKSGKLENFPFDKSLLSCVNKGIFPDLAIRINKDKGDFTGGELIELKDSASYSVSSFNSTIPSRKKNISAVISDEHGSMYKQMQEAGNDIYSLPERDVFYLIRGRKKKLTKVCLISGAFFETISIENLIQKSFFQVFEENVKEHNIQVDPATKEMLRDMFSKQKNFSRVRDVEKASVKLRFRIMTEVKAEGNILNSQKYPLILDNTFNFLVPCDTEAEEKRYVDIMKNVFGKKRFAELNVFKIKHHFNGYFLVFQTPLKDQAKQ
ncbi:MAG TPA: hypothetical protein VFA55_01925 [Candidatus Kapabacteria bacterium]|nr:hypothetical protein [Candidatus Kapabacteria bacterium]